MKTPLHLTSSFAAAVLVGCGGDPVPSATAQNLGLVPAPVLTVPAAPAPAPAPAASAAGGTSLASASGLYRGTTNTGRSAAAILFDTGEFWLLYTAANNPDVVAGAEHGTVSLSSAGRASASVTDYNLEGSGISRGTMTGTFSPRQSSSGTVTFPNSTVSFSASFDSSSAVPASPTTIAGSYMGRAATVGGFDNATFTVSSSGAFVGSSVLGCRFTGTTNPDANINAYHITVTFAGGNCSNGTSTVTGAAYFDPSTRTLYAAGLNTSQTNGVLFTGVKQ